MIFGDLGGLKLPDICLTGEEKPRKNLTQETCPDRGSNPGTLRDSRACYHLLHSGGLFLLPLFLAQLHFSILSVHFTSSILLHNHNSNSSSSFCSFRRNAKVSAPYNATLHTKHFTSLVLSSFSKGPQKKLLFLLIATFAILCFTS